MGTGEAIQNVRYELVSYYFKPEKKKKKLNAFISLRTIKVCDFNQFHPQFRLGRHHRAMSICPWLGGLKLGAML